MNDELPDRLSTDPRSRFYDEALLKRGVGIRFRGEVKTNIEEYCVSERWVRMPFGKSLDRRGHPMTLKYPGEVEPYFLDAEPEEPAPAA